MIPAARRRTGKYHNAVYNIPEAAPKKTRTRVSLSVMAFLASWTAANIMMPTVAAFKPDINAKTGAGKVSPTRATPTDRAYMPRAPGRLFSPFRIENRSGIREDKPPQEKCAYCRRKTAAAVIDAKEHFGASWTGKGLADRKDLLILEPSSSENYLQHISNDLQIAPWSICALIQKSHETVQCQLLYSKDHLILNLWYLLQSGNGRADHQKPWAPSAN